MRQQWPKVTTTGLLLVAALVAGGADASTGEAPEDHDVHQADGRRIVALDRRLLVDR